MQPTPQPITFQSTTHPEPYVGSVDLVPKNVLQSNCHAQLCVVAENEAVVRMVIEARSPTLRPVAPTPRRHTVWLFRGNQSAPRNFH